MKPTPFPFPLNVVIATIMLPAFIVMMVALKILGWSLSSPNPKPFWRYLFGIEVDKKAS